jgi:hypothetical protein
MNQPTFWSVFKAALPEAAGFYQRALPTCFRGLHEGLKAFRKLSEEGRVGAAFLALFLTPPMRMVKAICRLWRR